MFGQLFTVLYSLVLKRGGNCMIDSWAPPLGRPAAQTQTHATNDITSTRWQNGGKQDSTIFWHKQGKFACFSSIAEREFLATFLDCWYSRMQDCRSSSRRKPRRQKHWKEPALFWHVWSQPPSAARHSSTSEQHKHKTDWNTLASGASYTSAKNGSHNASWTETKPAVSMCFRRVLKLSQIKHSEILSHKSVRAVHMMTSHTVTATSVWVQPVPCWAVALITSGVVGAVLLAAGALLATLVHVCQVQQAEGLKSRTGCSVSLPSSPTQTLYVKIVQVQPLT